MSIAHYNVHVLPNVMELADLQPSCSPSFSEALSAVHAVVIAVKTVIVEQLVPKYWTTHYAILSDRLCATVPFAVFEGDARISFGRSQRGTAGGARGDQD